MAKRISSSAINWAAISERVPEAQRSSFIAFKSRSDGYLRRVLANPPEPPKINWAAYKAVVPIPGMVDNFEKQYSALKIDFPTDTVSCKVDEQWCEVKKTIADFCVESDKRIKEYESEVKKIEGLLPFSEMTMEDVYDLYPDIRLDPVNRPTFWPHRPQDQPGYVDKNAAPVESH